MRQLIVVGVLVLLFTSCRQQREEVVVRNGVWALVRSERSHEGGSTQYYYDLKYGERSVAVAGDLVTPFGTLTMAAPTDPYSDSGWIRRRRSLSTRTVGPPLEHDELKRGYYDTNGVYKREGTPETWTFQWFEPSRGRWMAPEKLFDSAVASTTPPVQAEVK